MHTTLNVKDQCYESKTPLAQCDNIMRRSNPVGGFYKDNENKSSFKGSSNAKTTQNESTISEASNTHFSKSEVNFHKSNSKKRLKSRRKNSKPKLDCKSTREIEDKTHNLGIYGSILQNTRNKRKSATRPEETDSETNYKEKYNRMKRMYEYEKNNKQSEVHQLMQENSELKKTVAIMKQDHYKELTKLKRDLEEALGKVDYYEDLLKNGRSRAGSTVDDISRMHTESKTGESTIESDKLANILKCKEDNIRLLMQELKSSNHNLETAKFEESKSSAVSYNSLRVKSEVKGGLKQHRHCETCQCEVKPKSGVRTGIKETCSTQRDVVQSNHINIAIRKNKLSSELTPEFSGPRGISMDSEKFKDKLSILRKLDSSFLDNSLVSEDGPKE